MRMRCPVCAHAVSRFSRVTDSPLGLECPRCSSRPRHRLLWLFLTHERLLMGSPLRVLHFAPEPFLESRLRRVPRMRLVTVDLEDPRADVRADIVDLPFEDGEFDLILCSHVLEHVPDDRRGIKELRRVLAPSGVAIVQSPVNYDQNGTFEAPQETNPEERLKLFSQRDHVRVYGPDLKDRLENAGFRVGIRAYAEEVDPRVAAQCGLVPEAEPLRNDLYVCRAG